MPTPVSNRGVLTAVLVAGGLALSLSAALSQGPPPGGPGGPPPPPQNLQVLPKDIARPELIKVMRQFSMALGVGCEHCHVDEEGPNGREDFATDEKPAKGKARAMMLMTKQINDELLAKLANRATPAVNVSCVTCHHGLPVPETLAGHFGACLAAGGADSAVAELRHLRDNSERGYFDVSERGVSDAARTLAGDGKRDEALAILQANAGYHPDSVGIPAAMAEIHLQKGDSAKAIEILKAAAAKHPENQRLKQMLDRLSSMAPPAGRP